MMACCEAFNRERLTTRLLASLARRFSWVDREELSQSIFLAVAEISDSYPNRSEDERGAIAYKAAFRLVSREALKASSPVSETWHNLQNLKRQQMKNLSRQTTPFQTRSLNEGKSPP